VVNRPNKSLAHIWEKVEGSMGNGNENLMSRCFYLIPFIAVLGSTIHGQPAIQGLEGYQVFSLPRMLGCYVVH